MFSCKMSTNEKEWKLAGGNARIFHFDLRPLFHLSPEHKKISQEKLSRPESKFKKNTRGKSNDKNGDNYPLNESVAEKKTFHLFNGQWKSRRTAEIQLFNENPRPVSMWWDFFCSFCHWTIFFVPKGESNINFPFYKPCRLLDLNFNILK